MSRCSSTLPERGDESRVVRCPELLLCVLAPTISYALPGAHAVAPCLTDDDHVPCMVHAHSEMPTQHFHKDGHLHNHSGGHSHAISVSGNRSMSMTLNAKSVPEKAPHSSGGQCCGLMCVTAVPATLVDIVTPSLPTGRGEVESYRKTADSVPPGALSVPPFPDRIDAAPRPGKGCVCL